MKRIYINPTIVRENANKSKRKPARAPITIETINGKRQALEIEIRGPSKVVYNRDGHAKDGVRVWIETDAEIVLDGNEVI